MDRVLGNRPIQSACAFDWGGKSGQLEAGCLVKAKDFVARRKTDRATETSNVKRRNPPRCNSKLTRYEDASPRVKVEA